MTTGAPSSRVTAEAREALGRLAGP
jgi:hypothetical protein